MLAECFIGLARGLCLFWKWASKFLWPEKNFFFDSKYFMKDTLVFYLQGLFINGHFLMTWMVGGHKSTIFFLKPFLSFFKFNLSLMACDMLTTVVEGNIYFCQNNFIQKNVFVFKNVNQYNVLCHCCQNFYLFTSLNSSIIMC